MIKKLLSKLKSNFKDYITNHVGTNIVLLVLVVMITFMDFPDPSELMEKIILSTLSTAMFTCFAESYTKEASKRYLIYLVGLVISILASAYLIPDYPRYIVGILLTLGFGIIYIMINNSKVTSDKYLTRAFTNLFKLGIVGGIINIGIMLILSLISALLMELEFEVFAKMEIIILIMYFIPALIISLETIEKDESKFIHGLVNYVLLPLVSIATLIIYLYLIKLIFTFKLPETSIFGINAALLIFGIPTVLMSMSYDDSSIITKISSTLRYLFIPLVLLQIYSLTLRISEYSITVSRYMGIILIILGIVSLILLIKNKGKSFKYILIPCMIISVIALIMPVINIIDLPNHMQINRLVKILPKGKNIDELTDDEKSDIRSIINYVSDEKYYPDYINRDELMRVVYTSNWYEIERISYTSKGKVDVTNYSSFEEKSFDLDKKRVIKIDNKEYDISNWYNDLIKEYKKNSKTIKEYLNNNNIIELDDNTAIYITNLYLVIDSDIFDIDAYVLYK